MVKLITYLTAFYKKKSIRKEIFTFERLAHFETEISRGMQSHWVI